MGKLFLKTKCEPMPICFKKRSASKHLITVRVILNNWLFPGRQYWIVDNEVAFCHCFVEGWEVLTLGVSPFCGAIPPPRQASCKAPAKRVGEASRAVEDMPPKAAAGWADTVKICPVSCAGDALQDALILLLSFIKIELERSMFSSLSRLAY